MIKMYFVHDFYIPMKLTTESPKDGYKSNEGK